MVGQMGGRWTADKKRRKNFILGLPSRSKQPNECLKGIFGTLIFVILVVFGALVLGLGSSQAQAGTFFLSLKKMLPKDGSKCNNFALS